METTNSKPRSLQDKLNGMERELDSLKDYIFYLNEVLGDLLDDVINFANEDQFSDFVLKEASNALLESSTRFTWKNEIKAKAIEETVSECMLESDDAMVKAKAAQMMYFANKLRGQK